MRFLLLSCAWVLLAALPADGLSISPTRIVVSGDTETHVAVRLSGESGLIPLELTILERFPNGVVAAAPDTDIRAYPQQILLDSGQSRSVRIEISSGIAEKRGRSFYLRIEQLGLRSVEGGGGEGREIALLSTFLLPVHVLGAHAHALTAELVPTSAGTQVVFTNAGKGTALLSSCSVAFTQQTGADVEIEGRWIAEQIASDAILPAETVRLDLAALPSNQAAQFQAVIIGVRAACDPAP